MQIWATLSSPSTRTSPLVMVVLPAAESPTTPRITGRGIASAPRAGVEHAALEDVLRLDPHELRAGRRSTGAYPVVDPVCVSQPRPLQRVADAASMREQRLVDAVLQVRAESVLRLVGELVGVCVEHQAPDREQFVDRVVGEVDVVRDARGHPG